MDVVVVANIFAYCMCPVFLDVFLVFIFFFFFSPSILINLTYFIDFSGFIILFVNILLIDK